jgi:hypothetical protein
LKEILMNGFSRTSREDQGSGVRACRADQVWRPFELLAMVLGFIFFWPVGFAVIAFKVWQRRSEYTGDLFSFLQERCGHLRRAWGGDTPNGAGWRSPWDGRDMPSRSSGGWPFGGARPTGNLAFDEWREGELARLEEERRRLDAAEREFAAHIEELRRARDREEFERFMKARQDKSSGAAS